MATNSITKQIDITNKELGKELCKALTRTIGEYRDNPESPCYKCVNYHCGCPADDWDADDIPLKSGEPFDMNCHSSVK